MGLALADVGETEVNATGLCPNTPHSPHGRGRMGENVLEKRRRFWRTQVPE